MVLRRDGRWSFRVADVDVPHAGHEHHRHRSNSPRSEIGPRRSVSIREKPHVRCLLALFAGLSIAIGNWLPPPLGSVVFTLLTIRTRIEERYLLARFPHKYGQYMREVGQFWPKRWR